MSSTERLILIGAGWPLATPTGSGRPPDGEIHPKRSSGNVAPGFRLPPDLVVHEIGTGTTRPAPGDRPGPGRSGAAGRRRVRGRSRAHARPAADHAGPRRAPRPVHGQ